MLARRRSGKKSRSSSVSSRQGVGEVADEMSWVGEEAEAEAVSEAEQRKAAGAIGVVQLRTRRTTSRRGQGWGGEEHLSTVESLHSP